MEDYQNCLAFYCEQYFTLLLLLSCSLKLVLANQQLVPLSGFFSRTTWVSRYQKGKPFWISMKQAMIGWQ